MNKGEIKAVHDDDLIVLLKSLDLYEQIIKKEVKCSYCLGTITLDNIQGIYTSEGQIKLCCNKEGCYNHLIMKGQ